ncbi:hypothetical protein PFICI_14355 [Pestalotiopsis fici W106-1]|uniref:Uncharacterized protein n=1 Tax=Pestalotiopsis fici (strain W106-1 / CGMCC3.15140) TaxID=1229662 RepID=W3WL58_PESFW|nr:uncharacterized protein PFICI_14355 [Pestalotiopsis fici W106-1]ETS74489.1 hypothetical protein PFICI_14355 [Pestalotiopsis fici W106-1]
MSSNYDDGGKSATDIITYIGVPLAVLGVLPILYNTVATLAALSKIKRMLRKARLPALTRSDIVNKVIEVELPRYAVTPWDRFSESSEYWELSRQPSQIPGGSWTTFNWKTNTIGLKTQRVEYADQLRQPQVEVAFDELVSYLLDLGAIPDAHGWKLLRTTGLWTPMGCALMKSLDGHKALTIAPLDDSDGHLSLAVEWSSSWTTRDSGSLPPYWVQLPPFQQPKKPVSVNPGDSSSQNDAVGESGEAGESSPAKKVTSKESLDSIQKQSQSNSKTPISCHISIDGLNAALSQDLEILASDSTPESLYIEHLRIRAGKPDGMWFASAATAYGTTGQTMLWNYKIPDETLSFAVRDTVPCGVLVLLDVVDEADTPQWATRFNTGMEYHEAVTRRHQEQRLAMAEENRMSHEQRQIAISNRMQREMQQRMNDMRDKMRLDAQRRDQRELEALQSPKWDNKLVAEHNLKWLKARGHIDSDVDLKDAVGMFLHRMVLDGQFASSLCRVLALWKAWADNGGMRVSDLSALRESQDMFARASLLIAMIKDTTTAVDGTVAMDLQECMRMWKTVRLG